MDKIILMDGTELDAIAVSAYSFTARLTGMSALTEVQATMTPDNLAEVRARNDAGMTYMICKDKYNSHTDYTITDIGVEATFYIDNIHRP